MFRSFFLSIFTIAATPAMAQNRDCIENFAGKIVCGAEAQVVRKVIRAEQAIARGEDPYEYQERARRSGSIYDSFAPAAFIRGGYVFAADINDGPSEIFGNGPSAFLGYRTPIATGGRTSLSFETEIGFQRGSRQQALLTVDAYTALASLRVDHMLTRNFGFFGSGGIGPAYLRAVVPNDIIVPGVVVIPGGFVDDEFTFGYSGRAGMQTRLSQTLSLEAAYRYSGSLGVNFGQSESTRLGAHAAEIGLDVRF